MATTWLFTIRDRKTDMCGPILEFRHPVDAERAIPELLRQDSMVRRHPADFELVQIGQFSHDDLTVLRDVRVVGSILSIFEIAQASAAIQLPLLPNTQES